MSAPPVDPRVRVTEHITSYRQRLRAPVFWLILAGLLLSTSGGLLLAREGTPIWRWAGGFVVVGALLAVGIWSMLDGRVWRDAQRGLHRLIRPVDRELAHKIGRAHRLLEQRGISDDTTSAELAQLHFTRALDSIPVQLLEKSLSRRRTRVVLIALVAASALFVLWAGNGFSVVEGAAVMSARGGVARFPMPYIEDVQVSAELPGYLAKSGGSQAVYGDSVNLPQSTMLTFRILPRGLERLWVLSDGFQEVPFVSDGTGTWVARVRVNQPADIRVGARLGEVLILDPLLLHVEPSFDRAPLVVLNDSPRTLQLRDLERLELQFVAHDDYGLDQIDLVVVSGRQEHRTELVRLGGDQLSYRGGHALARSHPLIARAFMPVHVHIEARDGDTVTGPKWGKSPRVTLLPPPLGFDAAETHDALKEFRAALLEGWAAEIRSGQQSITEAENLRAQARAKLPSALEKLAGRLEQLSDPPRGSLGFLRAQVERLTTGSPQMADWESALLATDVVLRDLSGQGAQNTAKELASALDEIALGARTVRENPEQPMGSDLLGDQLRMAEASARQLERIGTLGADLGSVAVADLGRAQRALSEKSLDRLERVAVHLAARLRRANASFGSRGAGGVEAGSPSGGGDGGSGSGEASSSEPGEYDELTQKAKKLAESHAREVSALDRLLDEASRAAASDLRGNDRFAEEAAALRRALAGLPRVGGSPGTASSEAALGKNQGEAMADSLEAGDFEAAAIRGKDAKAALERAARVARDQGSSFNPEELDVAAQQLQKALQLAEQAKQSNQTRLRNQLGAGLGEAAQRERAMADQADALAKPSGGKSPLSQAARDALGQASRRMRDAAQALESGQAEAGRKLAEQAQRELEKAVPESREAQQEEGAGRPSDGMSLRNEGDVPAEQKDRGRRFRERVQRGLARSSGALSPAVERYAEGLQ